MGTLKQLFPHGATMPKPKSLDPDQWCTEGARDPFVILGIRVLPNLPFATGCFRPSLKQPALHHATAANRTRTGSKCEHDLSTWPSNLGQHHQHRSQFLYCLRTQMRMISTSLSLQQKLAEMSWSCGRDTESMKPFTFLFCQLSTLFWFCFDT